ncbi:hypothetical protein BU15DRAFT_43310, partial [Melanogaster broomeanus]
ALGYALSILLYGILIVQTFVYHTRFSKDPKWIRIFVWILFGLETLSFAFALYEMLQGASLHCLSCIPLSWISDTWSFEAISTLTGLISFMAHVFYCWRIRVMGRSWYIPIFVIMISLLQCILLGLRSMVVFLSINVTWMIANFVCDLIITIETTRLLFLRGAASSFKDTHGLVTKLIRLTFETAAATTAAMLLQFLLFWFGQGVIDISIDGFTKGVGYANCLLATLNARLIISNDSTRVQQASTVLFDVPTSTIVRDHPPANLNYDDVNIDQSWLDMCRVEVTQSPLSLNHLTT